LESIDQVDPELLATFERLGIPLNEQKRLANVAVDAVFDSVSIATTFKEELKEVGVIFMSISEATREYPELVRKHMGSVVSELLGYMIGLTLPPLVERLCLAWLDQYDLGRILIGMKASRTRCFI
jgi:Fe-S cluster assembly protein SufB